MQPNICLVCLVECRGTRCRKHAAIERAKYRKCARCKQHVAVSNYPISNPNGDTARVCLDCRSAPRRSCQDMESNGKFCRGVLRPVAPSASLARVRRVPQTVGGRCSEDRDSHDVTNGVGREDV
jgi:hypothetical protein